MMQVCFTARAPGKIILIGEHAVVYGYGALATAVDLYTTGSLVQQFTKEDFTQEKPAQCMQLSLNLFQTPVILQIKVSVLNELLAQSYHRASKSIEAEKVTTDALANELCCDITIEPNNKPTILTCIKIFLQLLLIVADKKSFRKKTNGACFQHSFSVTVATDAPVGAGLGASASYSVVISALLLAYVDYLTANCDISDLKPGSGDFINTTTTDIQVNLDDVNSCAYAGEQIAHGQPSGIDNFIAAHGGAHVFELLLAQDGNSANSATLPSNNNRFQSQPITITKSSWPFKLLVVDTCQPKSTLQMVKQVREAKSRSPERCQKLFQEITSNLQNVLDLIQESNDQQQQHLAEYSVNVGRHFRDCHECLKALGVTTPKLDQIVSVAAKHGFAAKMTGAGGGGCAFVLIPIATDDSLINAIKTEYVQLGYNCFECNMTNTGVTAQRQYVAKQNYHSPL